MGACDACGNIFRMIILAGTAVALTLQFLATYSCEFVTVTDGGASLGLWHLSTGNEVCSDTEYDTDDPVITAARSILIISMIGGFAAFIMIAFEWLLCKVCCAGCLEGLAFFVAWSCGGATFMFYGNELCVNTDNLEDIAEENITCTYATGSSYLTAAIVLYLGCGILLCFTPQPDPICKQCLG